MLEFDNLDLKAVTVGIKYNRNFILSDKFGEIIDDILNCSKFPSDYFEGVSSDGFTKTISNSKTENYIKIGPFDLIYRHHIEVKKDFNTEYEKFIERIKEYIVPSIIEKYKIRNFSRIGIVYEFEFKNKTIYEKSLKNVTNKKLSNVTSIRFSEKDSTNKGRLLKETNDYINKIYSLAINSNDKAIFSYDYQHYYRPLKSVFKQCEFDKVINESNTTLKVDLKKIIEEKND